MFMGSAGSPMAVMPVPGWGWKPVMAVAELSSTISSILALWYTAFTTPGIMVWKKVESPQTVTTFWSRP